MPSNKLNLVLCGVGTVAVLAWGAAAQPHAQAFDARTFFTFSGPVELPGVGLSPGKYIFHVANPESTHNVVRVLSADGKRVYGMFFTLAAERTEPASKPEVRFMETAAGVPPAIKTWWMPGDRNGREFIYPRDQALRIARNAKEPVLTTRASTTRTEETNASTLSRVSADGSEAPVTDSAAATASTVSGAQQQGEAAPASVALAPQQIPPQRTRQVARASLPRTGTAIPSVGLLGLCLIVAAAGVRFGRSRRAA